MSVTGLRLRCIFFQAVFTTCIFLVKCTRQHGVYLQNERAAVQFQPRQQNYSLHQATLKHAILYLANSQNKKGDAIACKRCTVFAADSWPKNCRALTELQMDDNQCRNFHSTFLEILGLSRIVYARPNWYFCEWTRHCAQLIIFTIDTAFSAQLLHFLFNWLLRAFAGHPECLGAI